MRFPCGRTISASGKALQDYPERAFQPCAITESVGGEGSSKRRPIPQCTRGGMVRPFECDCEISQWRPILIGMADHCCCPPPPNLDPHRGNQPYRRVLWLVLTINAAMFFIEIGAGLAAGSASLQADALDFLGDAANYAISLSVVGMALRYRATAAMVKGLTMGAFGLADSGRQAFLLLRSDYRRRHECR
jgi:hypothetical protein